jgi:hypothetical protein
MQSAGFTPRTSLHVGVSDMLDAIVCGRVPDPEAIYYRNAKWLKELSQIGLKNHRELLGIMETFGEMRQAPRPHLLAA